LADAQPMIFDRNVLPTPRIADEYQVGSLVQELQVEQPQDSVFVL
jgi:hypothetical protein